MLGDRDGIGPAVIAHRNLGTPSRFKINVVVASAEELHEFQAWRGAIEGLRHRHIGIAHHIVHAAESGFELRSRMRKQRQFETARRQIAGDRTRIGRWRHQYDFWHSYLSDCMGYLTDRAQRDYAPIPT